MKKAIFAGCLAVMLLLSLTVTLLPPVAVSKLQDSPEQMSEGRESAAINREVEEVTTMEAKSFDSQCTVDVLCDDTVVELPLVAYLTGVVLAEMPASFPLAALEAQAVAARTFTLKQMGSPKHENAQVCSDSSCCQAYLSPEAAQQKLGAAYGESTEQAEKAVKETDGLVITYDGSLIDAVYFSCSGGATEDAVAVWGGDVPYLQSVESPGEEDSARYSDTCCVDVESFRQTLLEAEPAAQLEGDPENWFSDVSYTEGGGVAVIEIGGVPFRGTELRSLFGLRSTWFEVSIEEDEIVFNTRGYGHRVGMSQYGAQAMAEDGADFEDILTHYYSGVQIVSADSL